MNVTSSLQLNPMSYANNSEKIEKPKEYESDMWNDPKFSLSKEFPDNMIKTINKIAEDKNMTGMEKVVFAGELLMGMSDHYAGKDIHPSTMVGNDANGNPIHADKIATKQQLKSINFDDFLNKSLSAFTKGMNETSGEVGDNYKRLVNNYSLLQESYNQVKSEPIYA